MDRFGKATRTWFQSAFDAPTPVQQRGWEAIASGEHALLIAPTGSGKTLAAFLWCIDRLVHDGAREPGTRVLYVSPLKALVYDVERNLRAPLRGIDRAARDLDMGTPLPSVAVRTGDTTASQRRAQLRSPGDILVTTPESLYLLLGSRAAQNLRTVDTVIIDEVHALAPTKRGAHLAVSLERLSAITERDPQRIGLSATARPTEVVARFLVGDRTATVVDTSEPPRLDIQIVVPVPDMTRPEPHRGTRTGEPAAGPDETEAEPGPSETGMWPTIYPKLVELIRAHTTTILFVNSRALSERLTQRINELAGEELARSHHGSVSHRERTRIEEQLKRGELAAIVATSSLELGIDMGTVDLVVLVESPGAIARGLQRVGRAGHGVGEVSKGRIFPKHRGDLLEAAVVAERMLAGAIEPIRIPMSPLDVLAQQVVAMCASREEPWTVEGMLGVIGRSANFRELPRDAYIGVLDMLSGRYPSHSFADLRPRIIWDRERDHLTARRGSKMLSLVNGGTIPDRGLYGVYLGADGPRVGELDEEMVNETVPGQVFTLGATSWRVEQITRDRVVVSPAPGEAGKLPFWRGEGPGRPVELGQAMGAFLRELSSMEEPAARAWLRDRYRLDDLAAQNLMAYVADQLEHTGTLPTDQAITIERFRDELGDWRICILTPFGARIHAPWALALEARLSSDTGFEIQTMWSDDGIVLRFADSDQAPDASALLPDPDELQDLLVAQLGGAPLFASQFRENAARSLLMPRRRPGSRSPLWMQRLKSSELLAVARQYPAFPVIMETYRSCLQDVFDVPALTELLRAVARREIRVNAVETPSASPFARSLVFAYVAAYLYEADSPLAERKAQALSLDRGLLRELLGEEQLRELLDSDVIAQLELELQRLAEDRRAKHADAVHDLLRWVGDLSEQELLGRCVGDPLPMLDELVNSHRAVALSIAGEQRWIALEDASLYRDALSAKLPSGIPSAFLETHERAIETLLLRFARTHGPFLTGHVATRYALPAGIIEPVLGLLSDGNEILSGEFLPAGVTAEWCHPEVLRRIKRRTLAKLRNEVAPVNSATLGRFLPGWHGIGHRGSSTARLQEVLVQLEGIPLSYGELVSVILPARLDGFRPAMLDELGAVGWLVWVGCGALGTRDGKVALVRRERVSVLLDSPEPPEQLEEIPRALFDHLESRGASFFVALQSACPAARAEDVLEALWELVWAGLVTNDTFQPLRSIGPIRARSPRQRARAIAKAAGGRWSLVKELLIGAPGPTARAHARAVKLLERHGIVSREVTTLEPVVGGFTATYRVLREMEDAGKVRRGYFVEGLGGAQFAMAGAVDRLRAARPDPNQKHVVLLSAVNPANPFGWLLPWPVRAETAKGSPRRVPGAVVVLVDGEAVLYLPPRAKNMITFPAADDRAILRAAAGVLEQVARRKRGRTLRIETIDGNAIASSELSEIMVEASFRQIYRGLELELR